MGTKIIHQTSHFLHVIAIYCCLGRGTAISSDPQLGGDTPHLSPIPIGACGVPVLGPFAFDPFPPSNISGSATVYCGHKS